MFKILARGLAATTPGILLMASDAAYDAAEAKKVVSEARSTPNDSLKTLTCNGPAITRTRRKTFCWHRPPPRPDSSSRRHDSGEWAEPVFYYMGSANIGLQAGVDVSRNMLLVMTDKGIDALLGGGIKLGADAAGAAGPTGAGAKTATADTLTRRNVSNPTPQVCFRT